MEIKDYKEIYRAEVESLFTEFLEYFLTINTLKMVKRTKNYGRKYLAALFKKMKPHQGKMYVALEKGRMVGFVAGMVDEQSITDAIDMGKQRYGSVLELFVEKKYRNTGMGEKLLTAMEAYLRKKKCTVIVIEVLASNKNAYQFYKHLNYKDWTINVMKKIIHKIDN